MTHFTNLNPNMYDAVLFDLDGTLLDSAPDLLYTTRRILKEENHHTIPDDDILRPCISDGAMGLLKQAFNTKDTNALENHRTKFLDYYFEDPLKHGSGLFSGIEEVLELLKDIPWGIVTNKSRRLTLPIVNAIDILSNNKVLVCGDDLDYMKPHPHTILHACKQLDISPQRVVYVGDSSKDIVAGKASATATLVALYGYRSPSDDAHKWNADYYADSPASLLLLLQSIVSGISTV
ncbi:MAG: HAD-IA family hydrolase [Gammaproteobacteria bacterium]|nr:HAD-IA family hydrolase [Gammaproteobacteria bacterium]